ncbi:hypothetical protein CJF32_00007110 [Rutstroemia sp. NJR-2017a WRK4]|nr:hypothetical protein CJF32_00007110 [Rutstroemia sp. NJR-2017a WRK4]
MFLDYLNALNLLIQAWVSVKQHESRFTAGDESIWVSNLFLSQKRELNAMLVKQFDSSDQSMATSKRGMVGRVRRNIESIILPTLHTSMRLNVANCEKSYDEIAHSIQYHTLKAICYRNETACSIRNVECD